MRQSSIITVITGIFSAWIATSSVMLLALSSGCEERYEDGSLSKASRPSLEGLIDTPEYFERCEAELGVMPELINCREGTPIEFTGSELNAHGLGTCSNPSYGVPEDDGCSGTSFLVTQKTSTGSDVVTICRFAGKEETLSVAATIAHNPVTGATCFYQFKKATDSQETGRLPGPTAKLSTADIHTYWEPPEYITQVSLGTCVECHSAYPWVRNPYVLNSAELRDVMPKNGNKNAPYWVVARKELEEHYVYQRSRDEWRRATDLWTPVVLDEKAIKSALTKDQTTCLNCHRLGRGRMMRGWSALAVGYHSFSADIPLRGAHQEMEFRFDRYANRLSESARAWPDRNWHDGLFETPLKSTESEQGWREKLRGAMSLVYECGTLPKNCVWKALPEPEPGRLDSWKEPKLSAFPYRGRSTEQLKEILFSNSEGE